MCIDGIFLSYTNKPVSKDGFRNDLEGSAVDDWNKSGKKMWYYQKWRCMRNRASLKTRYPGVSVHSDWKLFSNFVKDLSTNKAAGNYNFDLDKDLFKLNNDKLYSKDTCALLPKQINILLSKNINNKTKIDNLKYYLKQYEDLLEPHTFNKLKTIMDNYENN